MLRDAICIGIGFLGGWIFCERPQWATNVWQWIKHLVKPEKVTK